MSLEAALAENTAALKANTAALILVNEGRDKAIAAAEAATNRAAAPKKAAAAAPAAAEPVAEVAPAAAAPVETKAPVDLTADPLAKSISDYVSLTSDTDSAPTSKEERAARAAEVKRIMATVGATKHSEIPADKHAVFIKTMVAKLAAGNLIVAEAAAEEPDELLG